MKNTLLNAGTPVLENKLSKEGGVRSTGHKVRSRYVTASVHIITSRTLPRPWFSKKPKTDEETEALSRLVDELLKVYKPYFDQLLEKEPWKDSGCLCYFKNITQEVLNEDQLEYNWTRIAMLLALACRIAQYYLGKGISAEAVKEFIVAVGACIEERINSWGHNVDRWAFLKSQDSATDSKVNAVKHIIPFAMMLASFFITVINFSQSSVIFASKLRP